MEAITRVGVVGLGTMGAGIAQVLLEGGCEVVGRDVDDAALARGRARIEGGLARARREGAARARTSGGRARRSARERARRAAPACELVIEAIVEDLGAKRELFAALGGICASEPCSRRNTSALSVTAIAARQRAAGALPGPALLQPRAADAAGGGRARGAHRRRAVRRGLRAIVACGKEAVRCNDTPGFIVNRLLIPLLNDAVRALDETGAGRPRSTAPCASAPAGRWGRSASST